MAEGERSIVQEGKSRIGVGRSALLFLPTPLTRFLTLLALTHAYDDRSQAGGRSDGQGESIRGERSGTGQRVCIAQWQDRGVQQESPGSSLYAI